MSLDDRQPISRRPRETPEQRAARKANKDRSNKSFWRACRYLGPYRRIVATSIGCALIVGVMFTGGISAMLPIMQVLINDQTLAEWIDGHIVTSRLGIVLPETGDVRILKIQPNKPAAQLGLHAYDLFGIANPTAQQRRDTLATLSDPRTQAARLADGRTIPLPALSTQWGFAHNFGAKLPTNPVAAIGLAFGVIALITCVGNVVRFFQEYLSDEAAIFAVNDIRRRLYDHVLHVPLGYFGLKGTSDVTSRLVQDTAGLQEGFKTVLGQSIQEPIKVAFAFGLALFISWKLTLFIVLFGPIMFVLIKTFGKKMRRASRKALVSSSNMLGQIEATLVGIRVVKGVNGERFERRRYSRIMAGLNAEQLRMSRIDAFSAPVLETLTLCVVGAVVLYASWMVFHSPPLISKTSFILVLVCLGGIGESLRRTSKVNNVLQKSNAAAARIFELLDLPVERYRGRGLETAGRIAVQRPRIKLPPVRREVRFEDVSFTYAGGSSPAVIDVSLTAEKGASVAIVGRNGSGKTTLLALLPRFYEPTSGRVTIDGVDVREATLKSLRNQISIVTQDSVIFPGTIHENIAYGNPRATRQQVEAAARKAFAHEFILEKELGYDTPLDGLGGNLSGGQKQRINIARAILKNAPILILDEATSQVDAESEHLIQQAIDSLMHASAGSDGHALAAGRTTFVIAHRFSTILSADTIVVMDRGQIVGQGKHDELLRVCPTYAQLYERQLFTRPTADDPVDELAPTA